jgi:SET domain-containing protein
MKSKTLSVKKSKTGMGLFAEKNFKSGDLIVELKGKLITCYEDENIDEETRSNTIRFNNEKFLSPKGEIGEMVNHSCNPNSKITKKNNKLVLIAIKPIGKGTEIFFDYSTVLANDDIWTMKCKCGENNCRKVVKKFNSLSKKLRNNYIEYSIVPKYILRIK